jgi:hypothetical protein
MRFCAVVLVLGICGHRKVCVFGTLVIVQYFSLS